MVVALRGIKPSTMETVRLPTETSIEYFSGKEESYETVLPGSEEEKVMDDLFEALNNDSMDEWLAKNKDLINSD